MAISPEQIAELEAKHGSRIAHVKCARADVDGSPLWECVFRKPGRQEWKAYKRAIHNPAEIATAQEDLALKCAILPARADFDKLLDEWPAIPEAAAKAFDVLLGIDVEATGKGLPISAPASGDPTRTSRTD